jgi:predicted dithiol-disulfide oxidoreductase (DUF899 family)
VEKKHIFDGPGGKETLAQLFAGNRSSSSITSRSAPSGRRLPALLLLADNFNGIALHLKHRDTYLGRRVPGALRQAGGLRWAGISNGSHPSGQISISTTTSFAREELANKVAYYNFASEKPRDRKWRASVLFTKTQLASCSTPTRRMHVASTKYLDLTPKGPSEAGHEGGPQVLAPSGRVSGLSGHKAKFGVYVCLY